MQRTRGNKTRDFIVPFHPAPIKDQSDYHIVTNPPVNVKNIEGPHLVTLLAFSPRLTLSYQRHMGEFIFLMITMCRHRKPQERHCSFFAISFNKRAAKSKEDVRLFWQIINVWSPVQYSHVLNAKGTVSFENMMQKNCWLTPLG